MKALEEKRRQIKSLEDDRARQLEALRQQLAQAQLTLTPLHPTVQALQQKVDALNQPSPELTQLHADERALMSQIAPAAVAPAPAATANGGNAAAPTAPRGAGGGGGTTTATITPAAAAAAAANLPGQQPWDDDGPTRLARSKLESAIHQYQDVQGRIDAAKIELEISRTAFKYRYSVITPPEVPRKPKKPITTLVGIGSVVGAAIFALLLATLKDMAAGRVVEAWQVRRRLKIEVLGEFEPPA
jgi:hypothetical protein